ncbi:hypothetical protein GM3709_79 [Geminocystis sp. NIES-3709]|nr:hypothetical protein GM3709_79 [Geminocystis sp. NIES-3709]
MNKRDIWFFNYRRHEEKIDKVITASIKSMVYPLKNCYKFRNLIFLMTGESP